MHCASCEKITAAELEELSGVSDIKIDHKSESGSLVFNPEKTGVEEILQAIKKAGYKGEVVGEKALALSEELTGRHEFVFTPRDKESLRLKLEVNINVESGGEKNVSDRDNINVAEKANNSPEVRENILAKDENKRINLSLFGMHCSSFANII